MTPDQYSHDETIDHRRKGARLWHWLTHWERRDDDFIVALVGLPEGCMIIGVSLFLAGSAIWWLAREFIL